MHTYTNVLSQLAISQKWTWVQIFWPDPTQSNPHLNDHGAATHVRKTVSCFAALRQLRHLRRYVIDDCFRRLVVSFIDSRLDFGNFILAGLPVYLQRQLRSVLDTAVCLVFWLRRWRPHHWRPCSPPLAACTTTGRLQSCGRGVSSTERSVSAIPESASSCCWSAWSSSSALIIITLAAGSSISSSYRRAAFVSSCCIHPLEQSASQVPIFSHPHPWPISTTD